MRREGSAALTDMNFGTTGTSESENAGAPCVTSQGSRWKQHSDTGRSNVCQSAGITTSTAATISLDGHVWPQTMPDIPGASGARPSMGVDRPVSSLDVTDRGRGWGCGDAAALNDAVPPGWMAATSVAGWRGDLDRPVLDGSRRLLEADSFLKNDEVAMNMEASYRHTAAIIKLSSYCRRTAIILELYCHFTAI